MGDKEKPSTSDESQTADNEVEVSSVLVTFITKQEQYAVPGASISLLETTTTEGLNEVVSTFLRQGGVVNEIPAFDFLLGGQLVLTSVGDRLKDAGLSLEESAEIEFFERQPPPAPQDSLEHDDWVASVHIGGEWLLTGCYDNTVQLWSTEGLQKKQGKEAHKLTIPAHQASVKAVAWLNTESPTKTFISGSVDQTVVVWGWRSESNSVECVWECRGHSQSIGCIAVDPESTRFATGSWDNTLKIWSAGLTSDDDETAQEEEGPDKKKRRHGSKKSRLKTPLLTLGGHIENVSSVVWTGCHSLATASWDHSLRLWDADIGGMTSQINGNTAFFSLDWSPLNKTIIATCADRHIRLYDPRASEGSVVQQKFTSHKKWVPSVRWSKTNDKLFISGGYDHVVKMWDTRSPQAPLYDLTGHEDIVLAVDWSDPKYIVSGSADCTAKVFSANTQ